MAFLLKSTTNKGYYHAYNGHAPVNTFAKHRAARLPRQECERVKRQLAALGFHDYAMVEEYNTDKVVPVST